MEVKDINTDVFADIFGDAGRTGLKNESSTTETTSVVETTTISSVGETTTISSTGETTTLVPDILGSDGKPLATTQKSKPLDGLTGYFEDRIKNKKFVALKEVDDNGNETVFVPKTAEEFDEVIDLQVDYKVRQKTKELEQSWYQSKSPAWQAVAKYAELVDDPGVLIPFLQGVRMIESIKDVDETTADGAEKIVRIRLEQKGDPKEVADYQIESLKSSNKLVDTAKQYKPLILNEEQQSLMQQRRDAETTQKEWHQSVTQIEDAAIKAIEAPIFGKQKLTKEEKAVVYDMIATPSEESKGYGIYAALDSLYDKRDAESMEILKQVALLISKKESFFAYLGSSVATTTAANLQKKLKIADSMNSSSDNNNDDEPVITRNRFTRTPKFGTFQ